MNTIVPFPAQRQNRPAPAGHEKSAAILFFTGVRYVREPQPEPQLETAGSAPDEVDSPAAAEPVRAAH